MITTLPSVRSYRLLLLSPLLVLLLSRISVEISLRYLPLALAWIPSFLGYYLAILLVWLLATRSRAIPRTLGLSFALQPLPSRHRLLWAILVPALLPITVFLTYVQNLPFEFLLYILLFSIINPIFEEGYWRGILFYLPVDRRLTMLYSAALFSFSHFFLWGYWLKDPLVLVPTLVSTFIMGLCWMWFVQKEKNMLYPILSHFLVDVFNLSVAVYVGLVPHH